jgi:(p)ppGpp synthase/HD superfamily hydrolase
MTNLNTISSRKNISAHKYIERVYDFFTHVNIRYDTSKTLAMDYFLQQFSTSPKHFLEFLNIIKEDLCSEKISKQKKKNIAEKYLAVIEPLCEGFGFFHQRDELNDVCFQISHPRQYASLQKLLEQYKKKSRKIIREVSRILHEILSQFGYAHEIQARYKSVYSTYQKMKKKGKKNPSQLHDLFGVRIILKGSEAQYCFEVLNILHDRFTPDPQRFKDFITIPKVNSYQSLHTALEGVLPELHIPIEVQIRTQEMHNFAEKGLAAHWLYSRTKKSQLVTERERTLLRHFRFIAPDEGYIYCLSCDGDVFKFPKNTTVLDYAYTIHTDIGNHMQTAKVNGERKGPGYKLRPGDMIKITTALHRQVQKNWIRYTNSKDTEKKIKTALKVGNALLF